MGSYSGDSSLLKTSAGLLQSRRRRLGLGQLELGSRVTQVRGLGCLRCWGFGGGGGRYLWGRLGSVAGAQGTGTRVLPGLGSEFGRRGIPGLGLDLESDSAGGSGRTRRGFGSDSDSGPTGTRARVRRGFRAGSGLPGFWLGRDSGLRFRLRLGWVTSGLGSTRFG